MKYEVQVQYVQYGIVIVEADSPAKAKETALDIGPTDAFNIEEAKVTNIKLVS